MADEEEKGGEEGEEEKEEKRTAFRMREKSVAGDEGGCEGEDRCWRGGMGFVTAVADGGRRHGRGCCIRRS